jgi:hypothetical protein
MKQFTRLLAESGVNLTTQHIAKITIDTATNQPLPPDEADVREGLRNIVAQSENELQGRFGLTFSQALATDMSGIGGWETTADFLELANIKSNAELRISAASSLLLMMGDAYYAAHVLSVIHADNGIMDVDACIACRALCHYASVDPHAPNWLAQVKGQLS